FLPFHFLPHWKHPLQKAVINQFLSSHFQVLAPLLITNETLPYKKNSANSMFFHTPVVQYQSTKSHAQGKHPKFLCLPLQEIGQKFYDNAKVIKHALVLIDRYEVEPLGCWLLYKFSAFHQHCDS